MNTPERGESTTHADDCERLLLILADAPAEGLSIEEIQGGAPKGDPWSFRTINGLLCDLRPQVGFAKVSVRGRKVTKFFLKRAN